MLSLYKIYGMAKIVVGLSGGVDSSVAALMLKEQGHEVIGLFMVNWKETTGTITAHCTWEDDWDLAQMVARKIDIPVYKVDLSDYYRKRVVDYMFDEYEKGRTPNPDVLCNREIKFDIFAEEAKKFGAEYVATGHYCRKSEENGYYQLLAGKDPNKDQSYFLCQLSQEQLKFALFPIGELIKNEVREIAAKADLPTATRKDSQGICFVGKVDLPVFLQQKLSSKKGRVVEVFDDFFEGKDSNAIEDKIEPYDFTKAKGKVLGEHGGAHFYTVGQRKGLNIGGKPEPLFVIGTDIPSNVVYVGMGKNFKGLYRPGLFVRSEEIHWVNPSQMFPMNEEQYMDVRIRYRQPLQKAKVIIQEDGMYVDFDTPQRAVTAGQFIALYKGDELIASGVIDR